MNVKKTILIRVRTVFLLVALFALGIGYRIFHIQYVDGSEWRSRSNSFTKKEIKATRGNIYADDGSLLATSLPLYRLGFDPSVATRDRKLMDIYKKGIDSLSILLSARFNNYPPSWYKNQLQDAQEEGKRFIYLSRGYSLTYRDQQEMMKWPIFREGKNKGGVIFEKIYRRFHPFRELAFRTVGFMTENQYGVGLESSFNQMLAGTDGQATYQRLAGGISRPIFDGTEIRPVDGFDVYSTLNINIQDVAESSLLRAVSENQARFGCVIVMEVATGEIKAMANLGLEGDRYVEKYNYAVGLRHYPGSTFKLASYMAMLEDGKIRLRDTVNAEADGKWTIARQVILEAKNHAYGNLSVKDAFARSSNIAVAKLVTRHFKARPEKFLGYITNFGLAEPLNFQIRGEERPFFRSPSDKRHWNDAALAKMSYGYEAQITPLQTLAFYNAVANGGKMVQPVLVREIRSGDKVAKRFEPVVIREKICSDETLQAAREMLEEVVANPRGTAHRIHNDLYRIAGKTGTAHKFEDGKWVKDAYYTSFAGFFPADKPRYSAIVIIDSPKSGRMAGEAAAPVFRDIADKIYAGDVEMHTRLQERETAADLPAVGGGKLEELSEVCNKLRISNYDRDTARTDWVSAGQKADRALYWRSRKIELGTVPDVNGLHLRDALYLLENLGYRVRTVGRGKVTSQNPAPRRPLEKGSTVMVTLG